MPVDSQTKWGCSSGSVYIEATRRILYEPRPIPLPDITWMGFDNVWSASLDEEGLPWGVLWGINFMEVSTSLVGSRAFDFSQSPPARVGINPKVEAAFKETHPQDYEVIKQYPSLFLSQAPAFYTNEFRAASSKLVALQNRAKALAKDKAEAATAAFDGFTNIFLAQKSILARPDLVDPRYLGVSQETQFLNAAFDMEWGSPELSQVTDCAVFVNPTVEFVAALLLAFLKDSDSPLLRSSAFAEDEAAVIQQFDPDTLTPTNSKEALQGKAVFSTARKILNALKVRVGSGTVLSAFFKSRVTAESKASVLDVLMGDVSPSGRTATWISKQGSLKAAGVLEPFAILKVSAALLVCDVLINRGALDIVKLFAKGVALRAGITQAIAQREMLLGVAAQTQTSSPGAGADSAQGVFPTNLPGVVILPGVVATPGATTEPEVTATPEGTAPSVADTGASTPTTQSVQAAKPRAVSVSTRTKIAIAVAIAVGGAAFFILKHKKGSQNG